MEALNCYSLCINACPNRVVAYTNRALCHLKLKSVRAYYITQHVLYNACLLLITQPRSAEEDCNVALTYEPSNVKALYRRALARKVS